VWMLLLTCAAQAKPDKLLEPPRMQEAIKSAIDTTLNTADNLAEAQRAQEAGDYARAATLFLPLATNGNPLAQLGLGEIYTQGLVIQADYHIALQWYLAAAEQGNAQAQAKLGELYTNGHSVPQDFTKALRWLNASAKQDNATAQLHLGELYAAGQGVPQDWQEAIKWYRLAAARGNAIANALLADCYENGQGTAQDSAAAVEWLNKAAACATDRTNHSTYLARRDVIAQKIKEQALEKQQQLAREVEALEKAVAAHEKELETARLATARLAEKQAEIARTAEKAKQKAAADAALQLQIKAYRQAALEAQAAQLKAQQTALKAKLAVIAQRKLDLARHKSAQEAQLNAMEDRRRAEINAEVARHQATAKKSRKTQIKARLPIKSTPTDEVHPLLHETGPEALQPVRNTAEHPETDLPTGHPEQQKNLTSESKPARPELLTGQYHAKKPSNISTRKRRYPAKTELTDEELGNSQAITGKKTAKQFEESQNTEHD